MDWIKQFKGQSIGDKKEEDEISRGHSARHGMNIGADAADLVILRDHSRFGRNSSCDFSQQSLRAVLVGQTSTSVSLRLHCI